MEWGEVLIITRFHLSTFPKMVLAILHNWPFRIQMDLYSLGKGIMVLGLAGKEFWTIVITHLFLTLPISSYQRVARLTGSLR